MRCRQTLPPPWAPGPAGAHGVQLRAKGRCAGRPGAPFVYLKCALALVAIGGQIFLINLVGKISSLLSLDVALGLIAGGVSVPL